MRKTNLTETEIITIEQKLNQIKALEKQASNAGSSLLGLFGCVGTVSMLLPTETVFKSVITKSRKMASARKDLALLDEYLVAKGYVKKNGGIDHPAFYKKAEILQPTWSRYYNYENKTVPTDTLLKIVLALRLPTQEAIDFMSSAGTGFFNGNERDMLILAFIDSDYLGLTDIVDIQNKVFDLLEYYLRENKGASFNNLYDF